MSGASSPRPARPVATGWEQARLLLGVHFRILRRQATATPARRLVTTLLVVLGGIASLLMGVTVLGGMWVGRHRLMLPPGMLDEAVHLGFIAVFMVIVLSPALGFRGNEFLDVTRLFHLPVGHLPVFATSTVGISLSGGILFWLPPLTGLVLGYSLPQRGGDFAIGDFLVRFGLVLVFLVHAVAVGQLVLLLLLNFLRSRRFRDLGMILAPLVGGACYLAMHLAFAHGGRRSRVGEGVLREVLAAGASDWLVAVPSRWLTEAVTAVGTGDPSRWTPFVFGFLPLTLVVFRIAAHLQERAFFGDVPPQTADRVTALRLPGARWVARVFSDEVLAIASKEVRLLRREPIVKTVLIGQAVFLIAPLLLVALRGSRGDDSVGTVARLSWALPFVLVFVENTLTMNLLGLEGRGLGHLRTTPVRWRTILVGKDLCYLVGFGLANAATCAVVLGALRLLRPERVPDWSAAVATAVVGGGCALAVVLAVGNVLSVAMPTPLTVHGRMALRQQSSFSEGCFEKLARIAVFLGTAVLVAPIPFLLHVLPANAGWVFQEAWWPPVGALLSAVYAALLLRASLPVAEEMARKGADAITARMVRSTE